MLSKYKYLVEPILKLLSKPFIKLNVNPSSLSLMGFAASLSYLISIWLRAGLGVILTLYIISLIMDSLDGVVARYLNKVTMFGAFLDSTLDRLSDSVYSFSLVELGVANIHEFTVLLIGSFMVSYSRARAEGLGIKMMGVGLGERAERSIIIFLIIVFSYLNILISRLFLYILVIITYITFFERIIKVLNESKSMSRNDRD